jgi:hypothetical protein
MAVDSPGRAAPLAMSGFWATLAGVAAFHMLGATRFGRRLTARVPAPAVGLAYAAATVMAMVLAPDSGKAFIYFQF